MQFYRFWFVRQSRIAFDIRTLAAFAVVVGVLRGFLEALFFGMQTSGSDIVAYIPFYLSLPFIYSMYLSAVPGITYTSALQPVTFATLLGLLPPLIDFAAASSQTHTVFYGYYVIHDFKEFPWGGLNPRQNYPIGEAITIWLTLLFICLYIFSRTKNFFYALSGLLLGYAAYLTYALLMPWFVSYVLLGYVPNREVLESKGHANLRQLLYLISALQITIAWFIHTTSLRLWLTYAKRILHVLPFVLLTVLGSLESLADAKSATLAVATIFFCGLAIVAHNDFLALEQKEKRQSVLFTNFFVVVFFTMVLFSGYRFALLGLVCFALSLIYHYKFFNASSTLMGAMKIEGLWAFSTFLTGVFAGNIQHPNKEILITAFLVFGGFSLFSILKDAKDMRADRREGRKTFYTLMWRRRRSLRKFHWILVSLLVAGLGLVAWLLAGNIFFFVVHIFLGVFSAFCALKSFRRFWFQLFLATVALILVNCIFFTLVERFS